MQSEQASSDSHSVIVIERVAHCVCVCVCVLLLMSCQLRVFVSNYSNIQWSKNNHPSLYREYTMITLSTD